MERNEESTRILARVRKMMNLANDDAASEGERENAMRMAYSLLAKYNLSMADAEAAGTEKEEPRTMEAEEHLNYPWAAQCAMGLAELFFCEYFRSRSHATARYAKAFFIGRASNVTTAKMMLAYIVESIYREAQKKSKEQVGQNPNVYRLDFCKGAARMIYARCKKLRADAEAESAPKTSTGTSVVLASFYASELAANRAYLNEKGVRLVTRASSEKRMGAGALDGAAYGSQISLHRQVSGGAKKLR